MGTKRTGSSKSRKNILKRKLIKTNEDDDDFEDYSNWSWGLIAAGVIAFLLLAGIIVAIVLASLAYNNSTNNTSFEARTPIAPAMGSRMPIPCGNSSGTTERTFSGTTYPETLCPATGNPCSENICGTDYFCLEIENAQMNATCFNNAQCGEGMRCALDTCGCVENIASILVVSFTTNFTEGFESVWNLTDPVNDCNYADYGEWVDLQCNVAFDSQNSTNSGINMDFLFDLPITALDTQPASGEVSLVSSENISDDPMNIVTVMGPCEILSATQGTCLGVNTNSDYNANIVEGDVYTGFFSLRYQKG